MTCGDTTIPICKYCGCVCEDEHDTFDSLLPRTSEHPILAEKSKRRDLYGCNANGHDNMTNKQEYVQVKYIPTPNNNFITVRQYDQSGNPYIDGKPYIGDPLDPNTPWVSPLYPYKPATYPGWPGDCGREHYENPYGIGTTTSYTYCLPTLWKVTTLEDGSVSIKRDLPGVPPENLIVECNNSTISISWKRFDCETSENYDHVLGNGFDVSRVEATFKHSVLEIIAHKTQKQSIKVVVKSE